MGHVSGLLKLINQSPTAFHVVDNSTQLLEENGFQKLELHNRWHLEPNHKYYLSGDQSTLIAFTTGSQKPWETGFHITGAHTDSPGFKLKLEGEMIAHGTHRITAEKYGSPIIATWFDRDLSIAGRIVVRGKNGLTVKTFDLKDPLAIIPNVAIHLDPKHHEGMPYNLQHHIPAIYAVNGGFKKGIKGLIAESLNISPKEFLTGDVFLYPSQPGSVIGADRSIIAAPRLDNQTMCYAALQGLLKGDGENQMTIFFNHEEVNDYMPQGAGSLFLRNALERITIALGGEREDLFTTLAKTLFISADMTHGVHPNYPEKHDPAYMPELNKGPVIKTNALQKYATTAPTAAYILDLCHRAKIPCQQIVNRSDMRPGSTIGPLTAGLTGIQTVDLGNPLWGMHSCRESVGAKDVDHIVNLLATFFNRSKCGTWPLL